MMRLPTLLFIIIMTLLFSCSKAFAGILDGAFGSNQIFDVQYYWSGNDLHASNFIAPYDSNFQQVNATSTQYFKFVDYGNGNYGLNLYNADGSLAKVVHSSGTITALGGDAIFYIGSGFFGNVISTSQGYTYGDSAVFTAMDTSVTSADLQSYTWASTTPLADGQTAQSSQPVDPNTTVVGTSGGMTASQSTTKNNAQSRRDSYWGNNIYVDQIGDSNTITIKQESANNTVKGYAQQNAQFNGSNNTVDIRQGAQGANGKNIVEIDYVGSSNNIKVYQDRNSDGTQDASANANHVARIYVNGSSNTVSSIQRNNLTYPEGHFVDINVTGSSNNISSLQISDVGKTGFINIQGDSNVVNFNQSGNAAQYAEINLHGNGHDVSLNQKDNAAHKASIELTNNGAPATVSIVQQGLTPQTYSITQSCVALPCGVTVTQGQ